MNAILMMAVVAYTQAFTSSHNTDPAGCQYSSKVFKEMLVVLGTCSCLDSISVTAAEVVTAHGLTE